MWRFLYSAMFFLAMPLVLLRLWWRGRSERGYRKNIGERFGFAGASPAKQNVMWIHAVSVGEVRAALPLIGKLRIAFPHSPVMLTCMTPTGRRTARELLADDIDVRYVPYDLPWALALFIRRIRPRMLIVMETELWPNLIHACHANAVPAFLVNARLSAKSQQGYLKFAPVRSLVRDALQSFAAVMAQSEDDATRLKSLGAHDVHVTGNMKFDLTLDDAAVARGLVWHRAMNGRRVILLASTRDNEELSLARAFKQVTDWPADPDSNQDGDKRQRPLLVIVPRHPTRFDHVFEQLQNDGFEVRRRRALDDNASTPAAALAHADVWLGDSMGEMHAYYAMCDIAIIGGSFQPLGGQNLIEAAALGKAIIMGPSTYNFSEAVQLATAANAMLSVADSVGAIAAAKALLADATRLRQIGANAQAFAQAHGGATDRTLAVIESKLE